MTYEILNKFLIEKQSKIQTVLILLGYVFLALEYIIPKQKYPLVVLISGMLSIWCFIFYFTVLLYCRNKNKKK